MQTSTSPAAKPATPAAAELLPAQVAKAALRRLVMDKQEPTPENYARAYQLESGATAPKALPERAQKLVDRMAGRFLEGDAAATLSKAIAEGRWDHAERALDAPDDSGKQLAVLIDRLMRGVERRSRQWTSARKKDSLQRVLDGSAGDAVRMKQRLNQLIASWENDAAGDSAPLTEPAPLDEMPLPGPAASVAANETLPLMAIDDAPAVPSAAIVASNAESDAAWQRIVASLDLTLRHALPPPPSNGHELAEALSAATARLPHDGATAALADEIAAVCERADLVLQHRHHLIDQLGTLCGELAESLTDLAEDDSWAQGQCDAMKLRIDEGLTARGVKSVSELLHTTRARQSQLRQEREDARDSLKSLINQMLAELGELGSQTGRFHESVGRYADVIQKADSLESLAGVVREMVEESHTVQALVAQTQQRLQDEHTKATSLTQKVTELESELRRLSNEVSTDQLTQIANRRGLLQAFEAERARTDRSGRCLSIGLLDIDNFKKLNDQLGHAAGDVALKSLAEVVSKTLRPTDLVARYGGEEFVVLLPDTAVDEGQQILTRLQRSLTGGLFMHESKQVFVTFSAGITAYRDGERIEDALERSDQGLYEAKRTGKNRTCIA
jgi:diguanylate cyclase